MTEATIDKLSRYLAAEVQDLRPTDLYSGRAGVCLALLEASKVLDSRYLESIGSKLLRAGLDEVATSSEFGLFNSDAGVLLPAVRHRGLCDAARLRRAMRSYCDSVVMIASGELLPELDIISGLAGSLLLMCEFVEYFDDSWILTSIEAVSATLERTKNTRFVGASWPTMMPWCRQPLAGLAHGASGVALALAVASQRLQRDDLMEIAQRAFDYERTLLDGPEANWRDCRVMHPLAEQCRVRFGFDGQIKMVKGPIPDLLKEWHAGSFLDCTTTPSINAWCHGGCGILIARAAWLRLSGLSSDAILSDINVAMGRIRSDLGSGALPANISLCHGVCSYLDAAIACSEPDDNDVADTLVQDVLSHRWADAQEDPRLLPTGVPGKTEPDIGLMTGVAGYLHTLCRYYRPVTVAVVGLPSDLQHELRHELPELIPSSHRTETSDQSRESVIENFFRHLDGLMHGAAHHQSFAD